jgi:hypothetical protein
MNLVKALFRFIVSHTISRKTGMYWLATNKEMKLLDFMDSGYLFENGWFRSMEENRSVNLQGEEIAWLPYSLLRFLNARLNKGMRVLEFGSGASSIYFSRRVKQVVSVEDNTDWYTKLLENKPENLFLILAETKDAYVNIQYEELNFELILVDGEFREDCLFKSIEYLSRDGVIVLDDTNAEVFSRLIPKMTELGFKHLKFNDFAPIFNYNKESTLFYRDTNCFGL